MKHIIHKFKTTKPKEGHHKRELICMCGVQFHIYDGASTDKELSDYYNKYYNDKSPTYWKGVVL